MERPPLRQLPLTLMLVLQPQPPILTPTRHHLPYLTCRHQQIHLCDLLGIQPALLNRLTAHPVELLEAMMDADDVAEDEADEERKYQREVRVR